MKNFYNYKAKITDVTDGDTFKAEVDLGFGVKIFQDFRVLELDTPEIFRPKDESEKREGLLAKDRAEKLLQGKELEIKTHKTDKYGRYLAEITLEDGSDFAKRMNEEGFNFTKPNKIKGDK